MDDSYNLRFTKSSCIGTTTEATRRAQRTKTVEVHFHIKSQGQAKDGRAFDKAGVHKPLKRCMINPLNWAHGLCLS